MNLECLQHCLTEDERAKFERDGFLVVENALPDTMIADLIQAVDRVKPGDGGLGRDDLFLELVDWPTTFPKVFGILGWNIYVYYTQILITPPLNEEQRANANNERRFWHQDSDRVNADIEPGPQPRLSVKVGFFLTDLTEGGRGNFTIIPGSHRKRELDFPLDGVSNPKGVMEIKAPAGTAVIFDRRLWHVGGPRNFSNITRKAFMMGYSYRWFRVRDEMAVSHYMERSDPIRRQLLGAQTGPKGPSAPKDEDVPLRAWMVEHLGDESVADHYVRAGGTGSFRTGPGLKLPNNEKTTPYSG